MANWKRQIIESNTLHGSLGYFTSTLIASNDFLRFEKICPEIKSFQLNARCRCLHLWVSGTFQSKVRAKMIVEFKCYSIYFHESSLKFKQVRQQSPLNILQELPRLLCFFLQLSVSSLQPSHHRWVTVSSLSPPVA